MGIISEIVLLPLDNLHENMSVEVLETELQIPIPQRCVLMHASESEIEVMLGKVRDEAKALQMCRQLAQQRQMRLNLLDAEFQFDKNKLTFIFTSDRHIDFRELVRDLFSIFKTRIWMHKINPFQASAFEDGPSDPLQGAVSVAMPERHYANEPYHQPQAHQQQLLVNQYQQHDMHYSQTHQPRHEDEYDQDHPHHPQSPFHQEQCPPGQPEYRLSPQILQLHDLQQYCPKQPASLPMASGSGEFSAHDADDNVDVEVDNSSSQYESYSISPPNPRASLAMDMDGRVSGSGEQASLSPAVRLLRATHGSTRRSSHGSEHGSDHWSGSGSGSVGGRHDK